MKKEKKLAFLGGDRRTEVAAQYLKAKGFEVFTVGVGQMNDGCDIENEGDPEQIVKEACAVILPTPCSMDEKSVYAPNAGQPILWSDIRTKLMPKQVLIGGKIPSSWQEDGCKRGACVIELTKSDRLAWKNALPTAEGALAFALQIMPCTVKGSKVVLIGYGRISQCLAPMLLALGAEVMVCARKAQARDAAKAVGCKACGMDMLGSAVKDADFICNTAPALVLGKEELEKTRSDALILDLASKPGGVDRFWAEKLGRQVIWALGLPGKVAPVSAGIYLAEEIIEILSSGEVTV